MKTFEFHRPLPWTKHQWQSLLEAFVAYERVVVTWWWEPYHSVGFSALRWAAQKGWTSQEMEDRCIRLSCPAPLPNKKKLFRQKNLLDDDGRIKNLDVEKYIQKTWEYAAKNLQIFASSHIVLPTVMQLREALRTQDGRWKPDLKQTPSIEEMSKLLTQGPPNMKRFQSLDSWEILSLFESLYGLVFPSTKLVFDVIN